MTRDKKISTSDFDYRLPERLIAQHPSPRREGSRLLVLERGSDTIGHRLFSDLPEYLREGDLLVVNNTRVFPARLRGSLPGGADMEVLLLRRLGEGPEWLALVRPGRRLKPGKSMEFGNGELIATIKNFGEAPGERVVLLETAGGEDVMDALERHGHVPLPPYIDRPDTPGDRERYQTVYATRTGAVAAPTAGLHFTPALLDELAGRGVERAELTLHVGPGTFRPVEVEDPEEHHMDAEYYEIERPVLERIRAARRVVAVGTTTVRTLESVALLDERGELPAGREPVRGMTGLFIRPGHAFRLVDCLVTNFHLPRSTLLMLVSALAGRERVLEAYREAVEREYRFYSYGDAMLVL